MKSNRQARRLFGAFGKISNTRRIHLRKRSDHWCGWVIVHIVQCKHSRGYMRRNATIKYPILRFNKAFSGGQHTQGERE